MSGNLDAIFLNTKAGKNLNVFSVVMVTLLHHPFLLLYHYDTGVVTLSTKQISSCSIKSVVIKITISSLVIGLKKSCFPLIGPNSLAKLLSDSLLLDNLLSDSSVSQSHSKI